MTDKFCLLILLDGLGDRSYAELDHQTPLQAASTPHLDKLASLGANGLFHADRPGIALPSENAHFALFGYQPEEFPGRGFLEALGADMSVSTDETVLLAHLVSVKPNKGILHIEKHRPEVSEEDAAALVNCIRNHSVDQIDFIFHHSRGLIDGILSMRGPTSAHITDTDPVQPHASMLAAAPHSDAAAPNLARESATALNTYLAWVYQTLTKHPVNKKRVQEGLLPINALVTQRPGRLRQVQPFRDRWGFNGLTIASGLVYWGLGRYLGLKVHKVTDSGEPGSDLAERIDYALKQKDNYKLLHVHTKTPDAAAHTKNPLAKVKAIESLDRGLAMLTRRIEDDKMFVIVTADHSTPSSGPLIHSGEPVPIMVTGPGIRRDLVGKFDEIHCAAGALGQIGGSDFMPMVLNWLNAAKLRGLRDTPDDQPYWPGSREPFRLPGSTQGFRR